MSLVQSTARGEEKIWTALNCRVNELNCIVRKWNRITSINYQRPDKTIYKSQIFSSWSNVRWQSALDWTWFFCFFLYQDKKKIKLSFSRLLR